SDFEVGIAGEELGHPDNKQWAEAWSSSGWKRIAEERDKDGVRGDAQAGKVDPVLCGVQQFKDIPPASGVGGSRDSEISRAMRSLVAGSGDDHEALGILVEEDARIPEEGVVDKLSGEKFEGLHAGEALARFVIDGVLPVGESHHIYRSGRDHRI